MVFMSLSSHTLAQLVVFGRDIFIFQCTEKGFVRGELADVEFVQGRHPFVREMTLFFGTAVSFQVLTITKTSSEVIGDVKKLQLLCLDCHKSVVAPHGILDEVPLGQVGKEVYLHGIDIVTPRVEELKPRTGTSCKKRSHFWPSWYRW
jgi:hypothetical protein